MKSLLPRSYSAVLPKMRHSTLRKYMSYLKLELMFENDLRIEEEQCRSSRKQTSYKNETYYCLVKKKWKQEFVVRSTMVQQK